MIPLNEPLTTSRMVGLGVLTPPPGMLDTSDGRGGVRTPSPTRLWRFRGSKREVLFRRILTLTLFQSDGERESLRAFNVASRSGDRARRHEIFSLSPSEREKVKERGGLNCIASAQVDARNAVDRIERLVLRR